MSRENFFSRWSRRKKRSAAKREAPAPSAAPAPPALDSDQFESQFASFFSAEVEEPLRRAALRKLFSDPRFNQTDGLDVYVGDYSLGERMRDLATLASDGMRKPAEDVAVETRPRPNEPASTEPTQVADPEVERPFLGG